MDESPPTEGAWRDIPLRPLEIIAAKGCPATLRLVNSEWRDAVNRSLTELRLKQAVKVSRILTVKEKFPRVQHLKMVLDDRVLSQDDPICTSLHATGEVGMISDSVARWVAIWLALCQYTIFRQIPTTIGEMLAVQATEHEVLA